jgi:hypothetical protein
VSKPVDDDPDKLKPYNDGPTPLSTPIAIKVKKA